jgi:phospholipid/cholesterol/gamma-HCH transport system substrate-binding protein
MKSNTLETVVGAAIVAVAIGFFIFASKTAGLGTHGGAGIHISAEFDNIDGVNIGSDVRIAGVKVGSVVGQGLNPKSYQARIDMVVQPGLELADDTSAKITAEGLLGAKFVSLEPGGSETKIADGGVLSYTQGAVDIWSIISQAMFSKSNAKPADAPQQ